MTVVNKQKLIKEVSAYPEEQIPIEDLFSKLEQIVVDQPKDPLLKAKLRGVKVKGELLFTGGQPLNSQEVAKRLGMTRQGVDKKRKNNQLLGLSFGKRGYRFPIWQFTDIGILPGIDKVLAALSDISAWGKLQFFLTGDIRLQDRTPLECLQSGQITEVIQAAEAYGRQEAA